MSTTIEKCIANEQWPEARELIEAGLAAEPDSHWLLTRLGTTYYEEFDYQRSLQLSEQALVLAPDCPLVLWDYAGSLDMLKRPQEALAVYQQLVNRGIDALANDEFGEGRAWARGLYADSFYRMSHCYLSLGQENQAVAALQKHLEQRGPGCRSIYSMAEVRAALASIIGNTPNLLPGSSSLPMP